MVLVFLTDTMNLSREASFYSKSSVSMWNECWSHVTSASYSPWNATKGTCLGWIAGCLLLPVQTQQRTIGLLLTMRHHQDIVQKQRHQDIVQEQTLALRYKRSKRTQEGAKCSNGSNLAWARNNRTDVTQNFYIQNYLSYLNSKVSEQMQVWY